MQLFIWRFGSRHFDESKILFWCCFDKLDVSTFASDGKDQTHRRIRQNSNHKPVICVHLSNAKTQSELEKKKTGENEKCLLSDRSPRFGQINDFCSLDELLSSSRLVYAHSTEDFFSGYSLFVFSLCFPILERLLRRWVQKTAKMWSYELVKWGGFDEFVTRFYLTYFGTSFEAISQSKMNPHKFRLEWRALVLCR